MATEEYIKLILKSVSDEAWKAAIYYGDIRAGAIVDLLGAVSTPYFLDPEIYIIISELILEESLCL